MLQVQQQSEVTRSTVFHLLALLILGLASILTYLPVSTAELLFWDTQTYVNDNAAIHDINASSLLWMLTQTYHANWHPLTWLSHAIDIQIFGFAPFGHHWVNVAWHVGCAFLLYLYSQQLLPRLLPSRLEPGSPDLYLLSLLTSLLFALHPQHVESVAWVAERKDVLCGFFYLACLYSYHLYVGNPSPARYAFSLGCAAAALLAKPMAVSLPVVLLLLDWLLYQRVQVLFWRGQNWRIVVLEKLPFVLLAVVTVYLTLLSQSSAGTVSSLDAASLTQRLTTSIINWSEYLLSTLIPLGISPYYPFESDISWPKFALSLAALLCLVGAYLLHHHRAAGYRHCSNQHDQGRRPLYLSADNSVVPDNCGACLPGIQAEAAPAAKHETRLSLGIRFTGDSDRAWSRFASIQQSLAKRYASIQQSLAKRYHAMGIRAREKSPGHPRDDIPGGGLLPRATLCGSLAAISARLCQSSEYFPATAVE
jgi:hypothetical protein